MFPPEPLSVAAARATLASLATRIVGGLTATLAFTRPPAVSAATVSRREIARTTVTSVRLGGAHVTIRPASPPNASELGSVIRPTGEISLLAWPNQVARFKRSQWS